MGQTSKGVNGTRTEQFEKRLGWDGMIALALCIIFAGLAIVGAKDVIRIILSWV